MATQILTPEVELHHLPRKPLPAPEATPGAITPLDLLLKMGPDASIEKMERLMQLWREWKKDTAREAFASAINDFKSEAPTILKNATANVTSTKGGSSSYQYSYAELDRVCAAVIGLLGKHGLSHRWRPEQTTPGRVRITCILTHKLGHEQDASLEAPEDHTGGKNAVQAICSTTTYLERYTLLAVSGLAASGTDTDGRVVASTNGNSTGIASGTIQDWCQRMAKAADMEQLRDVFSAAYRQASEAKDKNAQTAYIAAKDERRKAMRS